MMRNSEPQSVNSLLNVNTFLTIQEKSRTLYALNNLISKLLPESLSQECRVANYRQGILIVTVSSAGWLTRLRYEQEKLRSFLRQNGLSGLTSIQFKVDPNLNRNKCILHSKDSDLNKRQITQQSAELLMSLAQNCSQKLKSNLIKLAKHATKIDNISTN
ncbi:DciA family protein [Orbus sturtevantii]|uniref:DUF721 domain-containing protein n=1 Tax=Orbus sturtevantii TaxID=3074109 RepID=UPI00370DA9B1